MKQTRNDHHSRQGAALIVALWVLIILSLIVGSFAFEAKLEAMLVSFKRKKYQAEMLAKSGIEYARAILDSARNAKEMEIADLPEDPDGFNQAALYVQRSLSTTTEIQLGNGRFSVTIESAESGRNVNLLTREQWLDILEMANVPSTEWDTMIDCLEDWIDENDLHGLNGAESDDPFYQERGYPVKNGPLDSVEELLLVKGWGSEILYGRPGNEENDEIFGIADILTVWGDGKVNLNTANTNLLLSFAEYEDWELASVFEARMGPDGEAGTLDDGIVSLPAKCKLHSDFVKVTSVGEMFDTRYQLECIFLPKDKNSAVVYWNEGPVKKNAYTR
jgi:general secretion pathway protein K